MTFMYGRKITSEYRYQCAEDDQILFYIINAINKRYFKGIINIHII